MPNKLDKDFDFKMGSQSNTHVNLLLENLTLNDDIDFLFTAVEVHNQETYACAVYGDKMLCTHRIPKSDEGKIIDFNLNEITDITKRQGFKQSGEVAILLNDEFVLLNTGSKENANKLIEKLLQHAETKK